MPVLAAPTPMSSTTHRTWAATISGGISWNPLTPTEFCTVTAATATQAWTPHSAIVRESAWIPAPPPESVPAMVRTRIGVWPSGVRGSSFTKGTLPILR